MKTTTNICLQIITDPDTSEWVPFAVNNTCWYHETIGIFTQKPGMADNEYYHIYNAYRYRRTIRSKERIWIYWVSNRLMGDLVGLMDDGMEPYQAFEVLAL